METSIQAAGEASRVAPSLIQYDKGPPETAGTVNTAAGQGRWKEDSDNQRAEHKPSEAPPEEEIGFRTELLQNPLSSGSEEIPEVVIEIENETETQTEIETSAEFAAKNPGDRIKRDADEAGKDTGGGGGGKPMFLRSV